MPRKSAQPKAGDVRLTAEQDTVWVKAFEQYANNGFTPKQAEKKADADLIAQWPELAKYEHWLDALPGDQ